ncbi:hypothetical protein ANAEL_04013 [Anaerolineales bacterium]|nr:hypothetical protein ANAEL_04013 [Anaerolineales bacterium]
MYARDRSILMLIIITLLSCFATVGSADQAASLSSLLIAKNYVNKVIKLRNIMMLSINRFVYIFLSMLYFSMIDSANVFAAIKPVPNIPQCNSSITNDKNCNLIDDNEEVRLLEKFKPAIVMDFDTVTVGNTFMKPEDIDIMTRFGYIIEFRNQLSGKLVGPYRFPIDGSYTAWRRDRNPSVFDNKLKEIPLDFEGGDGLTAGDVNGDGRAEIIHGDSGDWIRIFDMNGNKLKEFPLDFEGGDGLTAGDVNGDGKAEIIHGDRGDWIHIFNMNGNKLKEFPLVFEEGDGLTAGDVNGDGKAEIIHGDKDDWLRIFDMGLPPIYSIAERLGQSTPLYNPEKGEKCSVCNSAFFRLAIMNDEDFFLIEHGSGELPTYAFINNLESGGIPMGLKSGETWLALEPAFDWPGVHPSEWQQTYDNAIITRPTNPTTYGVAFKHNNGYGLQYFFFYPFDDWLNDHEGDWENITVFIDPNLEIITHAEFNIHQLYIPVQTSDLDIIDDTHPIVYVGGNGTTNSEKTTFEMILLFNFLTSSPMAGLHGTFGGAFSGASYPRPGIWKDVGADKVRELGLYYDENSDGNGLFIHYDELQLVPLTYDIYQETHPLGMNVGWGKSFNVFDPGAIGTIVETIADIIGQNIGIEELKDIFGEVQYSPDSPRWNRRYMHSNADVGGNNYFIRNTTLPAHADNDPDIRINGTCTGPRNLSVSILSSGSRLYWEGLNEEEQSITGYQIAGVHTNYFQTREEKKFLRDQLRKGIFIPKNISGYYLSPILSSSYPYFAIRTVNSLNPIINNANGYSKIVIVSPNELPSPPDTDDDGISNVTDQCPNTPTGEPVDANGCGPSQRPIRISGGAYFNHDNYRASFQIDVNNKTGTPIGYFKYYYTKTRMNLVSTSIATISSSNNTAIISGKCTVNGAPGYTFETRVVDNAPDLFKITIRNPDGIIYHSVDSQRIVGGDLAISQ